jgi:probable F420-dependent oxidoreductase
VRIAFSIQPQHADYAAIRKAVVNAEEAGADVITSWDHFFPLFGDPDGKHFECWTMLAAWAEATSRVEIAPLVTPPAYRNPDLLADMSRTVDHISGGRLILGLGAGWFERDYQEYGFEFGTPGSRLASLEAAILRIKRRWAALNPPPTRDVPILIGGGGERKTLRYTAQHANIWHGIGHLDDLIRKSTILDQWCAAEGRDRAEIERSTPAGEPTSGTTPSRQAAPDELGPKLLDAGFTLLNVRERGPDYDLGPLRDWLAWRDEVNKAGAAVRTTSARSPAERSARVDNLLG